MYIYICTIYIYILYICIIHLYLLHDIPFYCHYQNPIDAAHPRRPREICPGADAVGCDDEVILLDLQRGFFLGPLVSTGHGGSQNSWFI